MTVKIRIDLNQGLIEAEGSESFVRSIYDDFKTRIATAEPSGNGQVNGAGQPPDGAQPPAAKRKSKPKAAKFKATDQSGTTSAPKQRSKGKESHSIVKDLDLSGGGKKRLKDFVAKYAPAGAPQFNVLFIYFMQMELGLKNLTPDHLYSCYRDVGVKIPGALRQSLFNTANRNGWLDTSDMNNIRLSTPGINYVEHDMPKKA